MPVRRYRCRWRRSRCRCRSCAASANVLGLQGELQLQSTSRCRCRRTGLSNRWKCGKCWCHGREGGGQRHRLSRRHSKVIAAEIHSKLIQRTEVIVFTLHGALQAAACPERLATWDHDCAPRNCCLGAAVASAQSAHSVAASRHRRNTLRRSAGDSDLGCMQTASLALSVRPMRAARGALTSGSRAWKLFDEFKHPMIDREQWYYFSLYDITESSAS